MWLFLILLHFFLERLIRISDDLCLPLHSAWIKVTMVSVVNFSSKAFVVLYTRMVVMRLPKYFFSFWFVGSGPNRNLKIIHFLINHVPRSTVARRWLARFMMKAIVQKKVPSHSLAISREKHKKCQREELG